MAKAKKEAAVVTVKLNNPLMGTETSLRYARST